MALRIFPLPAFAISLLLCSCHSRNRQSKSSITFDCHIISQSKSTLLIETKLVNNGNETFSYAIMSCDSLVPYDVDSKCWKLIPTPCEYNVPVEATVLPHESLKKMIKLIPRDHSPINDTLLRIRFKVFDYEDSMESGHANHEIWSKNLWRRNSQLLTSLDKFRFIFGPPALF